MYYLASHEGSLLRLSSEHETESLAVLSRANMLMLTLKKGLHQPSSPIWGNRFLFSPVIVEIQKSSRKNAPLPNWKYFLGYGQQFLLNASQSEDGVLYFCIGYSISTTCSRDRHIIAFLVLHPDAQELLSALFQDPVKVRKRIADIQNYPLRRYSLGAIIPGSIVPRVVGTILEHNESTQRKFFEAVSVLFNPGGELPIEYHLESKAQVLLIC